MPLSGRNADIRATSVTATSSTNNACTRSTGAGSSPGYVQINSTARRHWDPDSTPVLYRAAGGSTSAVSSTNFDVNYVQGKFEWRTGDPSTGTYTADVAYLTASQVASGREWSLNVESDMFEVSVFGSSGWKEFMPNLNGATVTVNRYWTDTTFFDHLVLANKFLVELVVNSAEGWKYEGFAYATGAQAQAAVDNIIGEGIQLTIDGQLYFTT